MSRANSFFSLTLFAALASPLGGCGGDKGFVVSNIPPAVTIDGPEDGTVFQEGQPVEILGRVRDDFDVTQLVIDWESSLDGAIPDSDPPDPDGLVELITNNLTDGVHIITLRATDAGGEQAEDTVEIEVLDTPDIPSIQILNPAPDVQPPVVGIGDRPFTFIGLASDPSDAAEDLLVEVSADPGGFLCEMQPDGTGRGNCAAALPIGIYSITFTVTDTEGFSASAVTTLEFKDVAQVDQDGDGHTPAGGDCNDNAITIFPGAPEVCDGFDNDCNPATAIDVNSPCYDDDGDGYCEGPPCTNATSTIPDCNDANPSAFPGGNEICNNVDDNCDGQVDEGLPAELYYPDMDADGYGSGTPISSCNGPPNGVPTAPAPGDCDDANPQVNPGVDEIQNGYDDNCNGQIDEAGPTFDDDGDGYCEAPPCSNASGTQPDCDDANSSVSPGAVEVCGDGLDNNCDLVTNEQNAVGCTNFFADNDGDGYGSAGDQACFCEAVFPYVSADSSDCDDANAQRYPGQTNYFSSPADATGSFDYNCDGVSSQRWISGSSGCVVSGIGCNGNDGWLGGTIPGCGTAGAYQDDCGLDLVALGLGCFPCIGPCSGGVTSCLSCLASTCPQNQVCDQETDGRIQECR
jgi:hypothetical protein